MNMYEAEVLADSMSLDGVRLTSVAVTYPHAVHKDMLRHRTQSRVVESFRARPTHLLIEALERGDVFRPDGFAKRVAGMSQGDILEAKEQAAANLIWDNHIEVSLAFARQMLNLDIAKQQVNFMLQDLCPLVEIITATDWDNYRALRTELKEDGTPVARPEVYRAARAVIDAIDASMPEHLELGEWHLPLVPSDEKDALINHGGETHAALVSAGRCARISYDKHRQAEEWENSVLRSERLVESGHMSPFEQTARPLSIDDFHDDILAPKILVPADQMDAISIDLSKVWVGNFRGFVQLRKTIENEHDYGLLKNQVA